MAAFGGVPHCLASVPTDAGADDWFSLTSDTIIRIIGTDSGISYGITNDHDLDLRKPTFVGKLLPPRALYTRLSWAC